MPDGMPTPAADPLNVAALCPSTRALGPGKRFAVWVQGCPFDCPHCGSPQWRPMTAALRYTPAGLADNILSVPDLEGITLSGGEPMIQAAGLLDLVRRVRNTRPPSVLCYTGFTLTALRRLNDPAITGLLREIDVLIDGPYIDRLNDDRGLRGSSNQGIHFLTGRYRDQADSMARRKREVEIHLADDHCLIVGVHPKGFEVTL